MPTRLWVVSPLFLAVLYAEGVGLWALNSQSTPPQSDPMAFILMGIMVLFVMMSIVPLADRVSQLEKKLADLEKNPR